MIELVHLEKRYKNAVPLADVNAVINDGDVISIIGPSGTGKSTLIRCIDMLERPTGGKIILDGEDICAPGYDVTKARVFQSFNLFGHLNAIENIMQAQIDILKRPKNEAYETGIQLLRRVGLAGKEKNYPDESALDPTMVGEVQSVIRDLTNMDKIMLIVTHELNFAKAICNRVFYMDQGGIYEEGTPEQIFEHPKEDLTRRFVRKLRVLELKVDSPYFDFAGAGTEIDRYCMQNDIVPRTKYFIRLIFEELFFHILRPVLDHVPVLIMVEHSEQDDKTEVNVSYGGDKFDPAENGDGFSYKVLNSTVCSLTYHYDPDAEQTNLIRILI